MLHLNCDGKSDLSVSLISATLFSLTCDPFLCDFFLNNLCFLMILSTWHFLHYNHNLPAIH